MTSTTSVRTEHTDDPRLVLPGHSLAEVATSRQFVREQVDGRLAPPLAGQIQLATSELVTNVLVHGSSGSIEMTVHVNTVEAWVRIASDRAAAATLPPVSDWTICAPSRLTGRGLGIVKAVSDRVEVERHGPQLAITACFELA